MPTLPAGSDWDDIVARQASCDHPADQMRWYCVFEILICGRCGERMHTLSTLTSDDRDRYNAWPHAPGYAPD